MNETENTITARYENRQSALTQLFLMGLACLVMFGTIASIVFFTM